MVRDENPSKVTFHSMGEPSWLVLQVLEPDDAIPAVEIIRRVERLLTAADYPRKHLDPSTLHYALRRMEDDGHDQLRRAARSGRAQSERRNQTRDPTRLQHY